MDGLFKKIYTEYQKSHPTNNYNGKYLVTTFVEGEKGGKVSKVGWVNENDECLIKFTPDNGYSVLKVTVNEVDHTDLVYKNTLNLKNITENKGILVVYGQYGNDNSNDDNYSENENNNLNDNNHNENNNLNDNNYNENENNTEYDDNYNDNKNNTVHDDNLDNETTVGKYIISVEAGENGTITPNSARVEEGKDITFQIKANDGYKIEEVLLDGNSILSELGIDSQCTIKNVNKSYTISATFVKILDDNDKENSSDENVSQNKNTLKNELNYVDINRNDWFYDSVKFVSKNGIMQGVGNGNFAPDQITTRSMLVTILYNLEDRPAVTSKDYFKDVKKGTWYEKPVTWAKNNEIVKGISSDLYAPDSEITREQLATILYRYSKFLGKKINKNITVNLSNYEDSDQISDYAKEAFTWAIKMGFIKGRTSTTLAPKGKATRAEIATIVMRYQSLIFTY